MRIIWIYLRVFLLVAGKLSLFGEETPLRTFVRLGDIGQRALPLSALYLTFMTSDDRGFSELFASLLTTQGISYALKYTVRERRPEERGWRLDSFPSSHTSAAFSGALFIYKKFGPSLGIPAAMLASLVGVSRVVGKWHHPQDVLAGAFIAILVNEAFVTNPSLKKREAFLKYKGELGPNIFRLGIEY